MPGQSGQVRLEVDRSLWICTSLWPLSRCSDSDGNLLNGSIAENINNWQQKPGLIVRSWTEAPVNCYVLNKWLGRLLRPEQKKLGWMLRPEQKACIDWYVLNKKPALIDTSWTKTWVDYYVLKKWWVDCYVLNKGLGWLLRPEQKRSVIVTKWTKDWVDCYVLKRVCIVCYVINKRLGWLLHHEQKPGLIVTVRTKAWVDCYSMNKWPYWLLHHEQKAGLIVKSWAKD